MMYQFHEMLDPVRHMLPDFKRINETGKADEMLGVLKGCGYSTTDVNLLKEAIKISIKMLDFERKIAQQSAPKVDDYRQYR